MTSYPAPGQHDRSMPESKGPDLQIYRQDSQDSNSDSKRNDAQSSASQEPHHSIGWWTPVIIVGCFLAATVVAILHYVYFRIIDDKSVDSTIPQSWNNALSVTFAHLFATTLATSASTAFTQLLWWYLRRRSLSISNIDTLFSLNFRPANLLQLGILKAIPVLWFFGLLIPLISVATIFPPGSLVVQQLPRTYNETVNVNTLNIDNRGSGSSKDFMGYALFEVEIDGQYLYVSLLPASFLGVDFGSRPDRIYTKIAKRTIREGAYDTADSYYGDNYTYSLTFPAPTLRCDDNSPNEDLEQRVFETYTNQSLEGKRPSSWDPSLAQFLAAPYESNGQLKFDISYRKEVGGPLNNISCTTMNAMYTAQIRYEQSAQDVTLDIIEGEPLNMSDLDKPLLFYDVVQSIPTPNEIVYQTAVNNFTMPELFEIFHREQLRTMSDILTLSLAGAISGFGSGNSFATNTIIEDTEWAVPKYNETAGIYTDIYFDLSASRIEDLMRNITISVLNNNDYQDTIDTKTAFVTYEAAYVLKSPIRLIAAYAAALVVSLAFIVASLVALVQNGTSAVSGGFLQIMCTTTHGDGVMNQLAKDASFAGAYGATKDLSDLKVRFGVVSNGQHRHAAFGTVDETETLLKGS
ncbi:hypothetical protein OPT61_g4117 [Boeremia exigua]|uniref:Uncharacterized protein n=1 Tax=Boeremia exigua TaxID=749465 RepID=A0ACC2IF74_9PLEO|nr:hypothetical protein OPT61_g4117 [Boeremia exigua]